MSFISIKSKAKGLLKNQSFRDVGTYSFYSVIEKAIPFFILPIFTRLFSAEDTGYYILFIAIYLNINPTMLLIIFFLLLLRRIV